MSSAALSLQKEELRREMFQEPEMRGCNQKRAATKPPLTTEGFSRGKPARQQGPGTSASRNTGGELGAPACCFGTRERIKKKGEKGKCLSLMICGCSVSVFFLPAL